MIIRAVIRIIAWGALLYLALPLVVIVASSVTTSSVLTFPPQGFSLHWYSVLLADHSYIGAFGTSTVLALAATIISVALTLPASIAIARNDFPGRGALTATLMAPLVLPNIVLGAALLQFTTFFGVTGTFFALLVGHTVIILPFVLRSLLAVMTLDQRVFEEASMDLGAGPFTTFYLVVLPQIRSGLITGSIFAFITSWINVELSIFHTTAELNTIPVKLFNYVQYTIDPTIAAVSSITIFIAVLAIVALEATFGLNVLTASDGRDA